MMVWRAGKDGEYGLGSLGREMTRSSSSVTSFSLCRLSQCLAGPDEVSGGREKGFGALWLSWNILLTNSGGRGGEGRREDMWVRKADSKSLLREVSSEARKAREGQGDCAEEKLERKDLQ